MTRLVVSDPARGDIQDIVGYLRAEAGPVVAAAYLDSFENSAELLLDFPGMGTPRPELGTFARSVLVKPYLMIYDYRETEGAVVIPRVLHGRRNITMDLLRR
jgi:toxin ParE1/3/4